MTQDVQYISLKIRGKDLTSVSWLRINQAVLLSHLACHSSLFSPPPLFSPHLSISFLSFPPSLPLAWSQTTAQIYRRWRDASGGQMREQLPVCLPYHSLWLIYRGGAFITLNYTLRLLPLPPAYAGRPWPYHLLGLPRRNVI